jgi:2-iminobutanoate/2-iminopropanoate deaminase
MKKVIYTTNAPHPIGPYSQAILRGNILYMSGQIAINPENGEMDTASLEQETHRVMKNIQAVLNEAGMGFSNVVKTTIFLKDMHSFSEVNKIYGSYFESDFPARETVEVSCLPKNVNVEISCIAIR